MDRKKLTSALKDTKLADIITVSDVKRWMDAEKTNKKADKTKPPLYLSVIVTMAASLDLSQDQMNSILEAIIGHRQGEVDSSKINNNDILYLNEINPNIIAQTSMEAEATLLRGETTESVGLWIKAIEIALENNMTTAEPYRMYGNLAAAAFADGDLLLGDASLNIALKLNTNYSFAKSLKSRADDGEFLKIGMQKLADKPIPEFISHIDFVSINNDEIFAELAKQGLKLNEKKFKKQAESYTADIGSLVDKLLKKSNVESSDEDYIISAVDVLWNRLINRPVFETIIQTVYDLEDVEENSSSYYDLVRSLATQCTKADKSVFDHFLKFPHETSSLKFTLHNLLAIEILRNSSLSETLETMAQKIRKHRSFHDFGVIDVINQIQGGGHWQRGLDKLLEDQEFGSRQMIIMGLAYGLLEKGDDASVVAISIPVLKEARSGKHELDRSVILSICDFLEAALDKLRDKKALRNYNKILSDIEDIVDEQEKTRSIKQSEAFRGHAEKLLTDKGEHRALFEYRDFLNSLGVDFSSSENTVDKVKIRKVGGQKVGRNEPCPCGSGKKYKKCHLFPE